jgi:hypothetical protein
MTRRKGELILITFDVRPPARLKGYGIEIEKLMAGWRVTTHSLF